MTAAAAAGELTAADLLSICDGAEGYALCSGYMLGVSETYTAHAQVSDSLIKTCLPPAHETMRVLSKIVLERLRAAPEQSHLPARLQIVWALQEAFPCPEAPAK